MIGCGEEEQDSAPEPANVNANPGGGSSNTKPGLGEVCAVTNEIPGYGAEEPCQAGLWCSDDALIPVRELYDIGIIDSGICRKTCDSRRSCDGIGLGLCVAPPTDSVTCIPETSGQGLCAMSEADIADNAVCDG